MTDPETARLRAENERLEVECDLQRALHRSLEAKLALAVAESDRLKALLASIERSRPWRIAQALRGLAGRRW